MNYQAVALTVGSAFAFGAGVYAFKGGDSVRSERRFPACPAAHARALRLMQASEFFAGYLLEQSLSVDNLFVFVLLFGYFKARRDAFPACFTQQAVSASPPFLNRCPRHTRPRCWSTASSARQACAHFSSVRE